MKDLCIGCAFIMFVVLGFLAAIPVVGRLFTWWSDLWGFPV